MDYKKVDCLGKIMRNTEIIKARKDDEFLQVIMGSGDEYIQKL